MLDIVSLDIVYKLARVEAECDEFNNGIQVFIYNANTYSLLKCLSNLAIATKQCSLVVI